VHKNTRARDETAGALSIVDELLTEHERSNAAARRQGGSTHTHVCASGGQGHMDPRRELGTSGRDLRAAPRPFFPLFPRSVSQSLWRIVCTQNTLLGSQAQVPCQDPRRHEGTQGHSPTMTRSAVRSAGWRTHHHCRSLEGTHHTYVACKPGAFELALFHTPPQ
jgi:hypothetical protein